MEKGEILHPFDEKLFIKNVFGPQLKYKQATDVRVGDDNKYIVISYCIVSDNQIDKTKKEIIFLLPGFGSGWTGMSMLAYYLVKQGYEVCMPSLPGYGNSPNLKPFYGFPCWEPDWHAKALIAFAKKVSPKQKIHWVGHSMGAAILTSLVSSCPEITASLTLLNPVGFRKRNPIGLSVKFVLNGLLHFLAFQGDSIWAEISKYLPTQKSSFTKERLAQRKSELNFLCEENALKSLRNVSPDIPICYLTTEYDFVAPYDPAIFKGTHPKIAWYHMPDSFHNSTMFNSRPVPN